MEWKSILLISLAGVATSLLAGKAFRRVLLLPFEWLAKRTGSKVLDTIVDEAERDLGIDTPTIPEDVAPKEPGKVSE